MLIGIFLFIGGLWFTALVRIHQAISLLKGRESILLKQIEDTTNESAQPAIGLTATVSYVHKKAPMDGADWTILGLIYATIFAIVLFALSALQIFLLWKILAAFGAAILLLLTVWIGRAQFYSFVRWLRRTFTIKKSGNSG